MARKKKHEPEGNHERWLVSYADFITLLFAFFTSMYAISTVDATKAGKMVFSTRAAFNLDFFPTEKPVLGLDGGGVSPVAKTLQHATKVMATLKPDRSKPGIVRDRAYHREQLRKLVSRLEELSERMGLADDVRPSLESNGLRVSLGAAALFAPGKSRIRRSSLPLLATVGKLLVEHPLPVRIEGHTDESGSRNGRASRGNWELSVRRALTVLRYFSEEFGLDGRRASVAGYASHRPVASNATPEGRALNRRVDIVILDEPLPASKEGGGS